MVRISKSIEGWKEHDIGSPKSPYHNKKNTYKENVNIIVDSFHNSGFACKYKLFYPYIGLGIDVNCIKQIAEIGLLLIVIFLLKDKAKISNGWPSGIKKTSFT
jgi:hypothetical protein